MKYASTEPWGCITFNGAFDASPECQDWPGEWARCIGKGDLQRRRAAQTLSSSLPQHSNYMACIVCECVRSRACQSHLVEEGTVWKHPEVHLQTTKCLLSPLDIHPVSQWIFTQTVVQQSTIDDSPRVSHARHSSSPASSNATCRQQARLLISHVLPTDISSKLKAVSNFAKEIAQSPHVAKKTKVLCTCNNDV